MPEILVLGVGPGSAGFLPPSIMEQAYTCDVLIGGRRNLELFKDLPQEKRELKGDVSSLVEHIKSSYTNKKVGILVSGDPGLFSLMRALKRYFPSQDLKAFPGISAVQYLFARLTLSWEDAIVVSLHGRERKDLVELLKASSKVGIFTDREHTPSHVCQFLLNNGMDDKWIFIGENLSYPDERIISGQPRELVNKNFSELNVVIVVDKEVN